MNPEQEIALKVRNLSKKYEGGKDNDDLLWALKDVNFELRKGDILGVIGRNGAGKSTLLKILSQIISPTEGHVEYEGILTSIIEIGTGFHEDLSGRENVFLSGSIMGISKNEIKQNYNKIVAFSELEEFMDMPVKYYSSGMYLRLAFSVAFHASVDILLLDEVMAVGDISFRRKCYNRIRELSNYGTSILIVSHNMDSILEFCHRCMLFERGRILKIGDTIEVIESYVETIYNLEEYYPYRIQDEALIRSSHHSNLSTLQNETFEVVEVKLNSSNEENYFYTYDDITIMLSCRKLTSKGSFEVTFYLTNMNNVRVLIDSLTMRKNYEVKDMAEGRYKVGCTIPKNLLSRGTYTLGVVIGKNNVFSMEEPNLIRFKVRPNKYIEWENQLTSVIRPHLNWEIQMLSE